MNRACRIALATILPLLLVAVAFAQQQAKQAVPGPSLDATLSFIKEQVIKQGTVNYAFLIHDGKNPSASDTTKEFLFQVTSFDYDSTRCSFAYDARFGVDGSIMTGKVDPLLLATISKVQVMEADSWWEREVAYEGHPAWSVKMQPSTFILSFPTAKDQDPVCKDTTGKSTDCGFAGRIVMTWTFSDEDTAKRVASALVHAVALCGGGNKDPF